MKRQFLAIVALLVLVFPSMASADPLGIGDMKINYSGPTVAGYYADYDIASYVYRSGAKISFSTNETFCISKDELDNDYPTFGFYSAAEKLSADKVDMVTWIANWATTTSSYTYGSDEYADADAVKGLGQAAIWQLLRVIDGDKYLSSISGLFATANDKTAYVNQWLVAVNPVNSGIGTGMGLGDSQDYLVKASVPEPATMLLMGFGVTGLVGMRIRKKVK